MTIRPLRDSILTCRVVEHDLGLKLESRARRVAVGNHPTVIEAAGENDAIDACIKAVSP